MLVLSLFAVLGLAHYALIGTRFDRRWVKYVFITLDIAVVSALVATQPLYPNAAGLPAVVAFRAPVFPFYFVILGVAAFSFSPAMVMWTDCRRARLAFRLPACGKHGRRRAELERDPGQPDGRADHGGRARSQFGGSAPGSRRQSRS